MQSRIFNFMYIHCRYAEKNRIHYIIIIKLHPIIRFVRIRTIDFILYNYLYSQHVNKNSHCNRVPGFF